MLNFGAKTTITPTPARSTNKGKEEEEEEEGENLGEEKPKGSAAGRKKLPVIVPDHTLEPILKEVLFLILLSIIYLDFTKDF